ncbi:MAG: radical SAM protein [Clostridia bacterium]|nr:radical SAM protein [Clostridia bacterium]
MEQKATPYSDLKLFAHPDKLKALADGARTAPIYVRIKPTNVCNHHCNYCHYGSGQYLNLEGQQSKNQIPWDKLKEIISDLGDIGVKAVTFSGGGEPLVYPRIVPAMEAVLNRNIDLSIITNGHLLFGATADILKSAKWVRISFDAANEATYSQIREVSTDSFKKVCDNIYRFAKQKPGNCELGINFVVNKENAGEVFAAGKLMFELGVNHIKYTARMINDVETYHSPFKKAVIEQITKVEETCKRKDFKVINLYEQDFNLCGVFKRTYSKCLVKEFVTVIAADSKVYYCHDKAYLENGIIGDLTQLSFKELWFSNSTVQKFKDFDAIRECNHHCVYDSRNILLNTFFSLDKNHVNFI